MPIKLLNHQKIKKRSADPVNSCFVHKELTFKFNDSYYYHRNNITFELLMHIYCQIQFNTQQQVFHEIYCIAFSVTLSLFDAHVWEARFMKFNGD